MTEPEPVNGAGPVSEPGAVDGAGPVSGPSGVSEPGAGGHDLSGGGDVLARITRFAADDRPPPGILPRPGGIASSTGHPSA